jgi:hypothetical protein
MKRIFDKARAGLLTRPISPMEDLLLRPRGLAEALDLLETSEGLSVPETDHSAPLTVLLKVSMGAVFPVAAIALAVSPAAMAPEVSVEAIHSVDSPAEATLVAEVMAEVTDNRQNPLTPKRTVRSSFLGSPHWL